MSESIRVTGKTVEDAITNATIKLGLTSDKIEYTVIEHETKGFLGFGAREAVIEVKIKEVKSDEEILKEAELAKKQEEKADKEKKAQEKSRQNQQTRKKEEGRRKEEAVRKNTVPEKKAPAPEKKEPEKAESASAETAVNTDISSEEGKAQETERNQRRERENHPLENPEEAIAKAEEFLKDVYRSMGMEAELKSVYDGEILNIQMNGDDMGVLIGKRGQTLDSLQYLTSLVVNRNSPSYVRVKLDTENYRERRKATLENLAKNIAIKVKKNRTSVYLEPMNPYERRIIHSALQDDPFVCTHSEGEEPDRKVVVSLKKDADMEALDRKYGERRGRGVRGSYRGRGGKQDRRGSYRKRDYSKGENKYHDSEEFLSGENRYAKKESDNYTAPVFDEEKND